ncbi:retrotransposon protein, putative, ty3-gypsy subclass [Tanacetum coccineum]
MSNIYICVGNSYTEEVSMRSFRSSELPGLLASRFPSLGQIVSADASLWIHPKVEAITKWPTSHLTVTELMRKGEKIVWTDERSKDLEDETEICVCSDIDSSIRFRWMMTMCVFEDRLCVPNDQALREKVMTEAHSSPFTIHLGSTKMYRDLKQYFWWNGMKQDVATVLPTTSQKRHDAILVMVVDRQPTLSYSLPIQKNYSINGQSERTIQTLEDMLRACALEWTGSWDEYLCLIATESYADNSDVDCIVSSRRSCISVKFRHSEE